MATVSSDSHTRDPRHSLQTSGATDAVWVHLDPPSNRPTFPTLDRDIETDICVIGSGIAGIQTAYELINRGKEVTLIEAREVLSGETGRTSGHLASALDDGYTNIKGKHGFSGARAAAESHQWAIGRVGEIAKTLNIDCEYRTLPGYDISQWPRGDKKHDEDVKMLRDEVAEAQAVGLDAEWRDGYAIQGWDGKPDQRDAAVFRNQATFHPTKYLNAVLKWLKDQPKFQCFTNTRALAIEEKGIEVLGIGSKTVHIKTEGGQNIKANYAVEATCVPLQKLSIVAEMEFNRTYCIAIRIPKGSVEDCLLYDSAEEYKYIRMTACDDKDDYMVVGGCDHKVGQEDPDGRFEELEQWTRERFTHAGSVDYKWSGQVFEPVDYMAFIGQNQGNKHTFVVTGDSGNGLTHGVIAGRLLADEIEGVPNPWSKAYSPTRLASIVKSAGSMLSHDLQINAQYKRFLQSDIKDIEDLAPGSGGVLNPTAGKPVAVYKDENGKVEKFSALCPHMKGVVCWNGLEKSWDCPVHGSRFSKEGICVIGPAKGNLNPADEAGQQSQQATAA